MCNGITGVNKNPDIDSLRGVQDISSTQTGDVNSQRDVDLQIEQRLGTVPRNPDSVRVSSQQTVSTRPIRSLRGTNPRGVGQNPQRLQRARVMARAGLPKQIGIAMPPSSTAVHLNSQMIAKEIQSLPQNVRQQAINSAGKILQQRVNNGFKVYQQVLAGTATTPATLNDVRDFMTFLTARASQKTSSFAQGAFNLPDPGNKIRNFLDSSTEVYQRTSTHIEGFTDHTGCGHRGIDLKLPHGMGTLLYGGMKDGVQGTDGDRIFLKMESHGCRISTLSNDKVDTEGPQSRPKRFFSDLLSSIKHGWGGIKTLLGLQKTEGTRKERVDKGVEREFKALVQMAQESGVEGLEEMLNANDPAGTRTGRGIRTMMENIDSVLLKAKGESRVDEDGFVEIELDEQNILNLPEELKTKLENFQERIRNSYDHVEHRIGNELILSTEELAGTGTKETMRDGHARALVTQFMTIQNGDSVTTEDIKGLLTTMYSLTSNIDGEGSDEVKTQRDTSLRKAINGLSTEQKAHLSEIVTSDKIVSLANEFAGRSMGLRLKLPGHRLSDQQGLNIRGLMAGSMKIIFAMVQEVGGEVRQDGEYRGGPMGDLTDTVFNLTNSLSEVKSQEDIQQYLSGVKIEDRSAIQIKEFSGRENMVLGSSAKAMFPDGLPRVNSRDVNAKAKELVEDLLTNPPGTVDTETLWGGFGISESFMKDFKRDAVIVNGESFGGPMPDPENISELSDLEITKLKNEFFENQILGFIDAVGSPAKAITVSRLMWQDVDKVSEVSHFLHTGETGQDLFTGQMNVISQDGGEVPAGGTRSITINEDGSAIISLTHSKGKMTDQVLYNSEVGIRLSNLDGEIDSISGVNVAMIFTSND